MDLRPGRAVGELEEAGEHVVALGCVREYGVLEVDPVGEDAVVLVHPGGGYAGSYGGGWIASDSIATYIKCMHRVTHSACEKRTVHIHYFN